MKSKGFTLIELLVVVAVIGILSTIVLSSLGSARERANDTAIKTALSQMRAQAELIYLQTGSYDSVCDENSETGIMFADAFESANMSGNGAVATCLDVDSYLYANSSSPSLTTGGNSAGAEGETLWGAAILLNGGGWFCVDSNGAATTTSARPIKVASNEMTC